MKYLLFRVYEGRGHTNLNKEFVDIDEPVTSPLTTETLIKVLRKSKIQHVADPADMVETSPEYANVVSYLDGIIRNEEASLTEDGDIVIYGDEDSLYIIPIPA